MYNGMLRRIVAVGGAGYQALCKVCNADKARERGEWGTRGPARHGTYAEYQHGCRCLECKAANAAYAREYHRKWRLAHPNDISRQRRWQIKQRDLDKYGA